MRVNFSCNSSTIFKHDWLRIGLEKLDFALLDDSSFTMAMDLAKHFPRLSDTCNPRWRSEYDFNFGNVAQPMTDLHGSREENRSMSWLLVGMMGSIIQVNISRKYSSPMDPSWGKGDVVWCGCVLFLDDISGRPSMVDKKAKMAEYSIVIVSDVWRNKHFLRKFLLHHPNDSQPFINMDGHQVPGNIYLSGFPAWRLSDLKRALQMLSRAFCTPYITNSKLKGGWPFLGGMSMAHTWASIFYNQWKRSPRENSDLVEED